MALSFDGMRNPSFDPGAETVTKGTRAVPPTHTPFTLNWTAVDESLSEKACPLGGELNFPGITCSLARPHNCRTELAV